MVGVSTRLASFRIRSSSYPWEGPGPYYKASEHMITPLDRASPTSQPPYPGGFMNFEEFLSRVSYFPREKKPPTSLA